MPTITIDGQEHTVEVEAIKFENGHRVVTDKEIEAQYVPRSLIEGDEAQYVNKQSFERRYKNYINREKAAEDEAIVSAVLQKHGEAFKAENLEEAKAQWDRAEADPLRKQLEERDGNLKTFESQVIGSAIEAAGRTVWKDEFASAPDGRQSWAQVNFQNEFAYDRDHGYVVAVNAKGEPISSSKPTQRRPYMGVEERFKMLADEDAYKPFARPAERITTGDGVNPNKGGGGKDAKRSEMTDAQRAAYIVEHGQEAYFALSN